jgi:hypothetical protein
MIPNILAVTVSDNQLTLFDLKVMAPGLSLDLAILSSEQPRFRWRLVQKHEGYDDRIEIYVVRGDCIEFVAADFKRKHFELRGNQEQ